MTCEEILAMEVGKEIDSLLAVKVMGWEIRRIYNTDDSYHEYYYRNGVKYENVDYPDHWQPSKFMDTAWEVVERMQGNYNFFLAYNHKDKDFQAFFDVPNGDDSATIESYQYDAPTAPEAICKAALLAVMAQA